MIGKKVQYEEGRAYHIGTIVDKIRVGNIENVRQPYAHQDHSRQDDWNVKLTPVSYSEDWYLIADEKGKLASVPCRFVIRIVEGEAEPAGHLIYMTVPDIVEKFGEQLSSEQIDELKKLTHYEKQEYEVPQEEEKEYRPAELLKERGVI
jgi:hypothetical protein